MMRLRPSYVLLDRNKIIHEVGGGELGSVYEAGDILMDKDAAIKKPTPRWVRNSTIRTHCKAGACTTIESLRERLVDGHNVLREGDRYSGTRDCVFMEYAPGGSLEQRLCQAVPYGRPGMLPVDETVQIALRAYAHIHCALERGTVRSKPEPASVQLDAPGDAKLASRCLTHIIREDASRTPIGQGG